MTAEECRKTLEAWQRLDVDVYASEGSLVDDRQVAVSARPGFGTAAEETEQFRRWMAWVETAVDHGGIRVN